MNTIEFSHNWNNKLDCTYFTTLRLSDRFQPCEWLIVMFKNAIKGRAVVLDKKALKISSLNGWICGLDTGYGTPETIKILEKMYPGKINDNTTIYLYLLRYESKTERSNRELLERGAQTEMQL